MNPISRLSRQTYNAQVVPRSHLWDHSRQARMEDAVPAEMTVSEALLFLGSTAHAGGANLSLQHRTVHGFFYCRSWLRPEVSTAPSSRGTVLDTLQSRSTERMIGESAFVVDQERGSTMVYWSTETSRICARKSIHWTLRRN